MKLSDISDYVIIGLAALVTFGIVGQSTGLLPSTKDTFAPAPMVEIAAVTPEVAPSVTPTRPAQKSEAATKVFDALRWGLGFEAS